MELFIPLLLIILGSLIFYYVIIKTRRRKPDHQLPPGSSGWPLIGETLEYLRTANYGVPEKFVADRRNKYSTDGNPCKVFKTSLFGQSFVIMCTAAGNKFLFSNEKKLVKSWWPAHFLKVFPHEVDLASRKALSPFLRPDALRKYIGTMDQVTRRHFDVYWASSPSDPDQHVIKAYTVIQKHVITLSCRLFLNIDDPEEVAKLEESMKLLAPGLFMPIDLPGTRFNRAIKASNHIKKVIKKMVVQRKMDLMNLNNNAGGGDPAAASVHGEDLLISSLLKETSNDGAPLTESYITDKLFTILFGAYDTILITTSTIIMFLAELPRVYDAVLKEQMEIADSKAPGELLNMADLQKMKYTWKVASEVLRLEPPCHGTFREAITDFEYEGYRIPKGMKIHWSVFATHKNPLYFPEPQKFDPSRFEGEGPPPFSFVPFGGGPRMCPGLDYARVTVLVFLHNLVTRFKWDKVFLDEKMVRDPILTPTKGLPIRLYPHSHDSRDEKFKQY